MCGIAGFKCFGNVSPSQEVVEEIFENIMDRGTDASGIAYLTRLDKNLHVFKNKKKSSELIKSDEWKKIKFNKIHTAILHTRAATKGDESNNKNNHPIYSKEGIAIVHNGVISNDDMLFRRENYTRDAEVDSEIILKLIEKDWWNDISKNKKINMLQGSFAVASINAKLPKELILFRHTNPIHVYMDTENDILFFASTKEHLTRVFNQYHRGFKIREAFVFELPNNVAYKIDETGICEIDDIDISYKSTYYSGNAQSGFNQDFWNKDNKKDHRKKNNDEKKDTTNSALTPSFKECPCCKSQIRVTDMYLVGKTLLCEACVLDYAEGNKLECPFCTNALAMSEILNEKCSRCGNDVKTNSVNFV